MVHRMVKIYLSFKTVRRFFHFPLHLKYEGKFVWPYNINLSIWRRKLRILLPSYCYLKLNKSHDSQIEHSAKIKTCERRVKNFLPTKQSFQRMSWRIYYKSKHEISLCLYIYFAIEKIEVKRNLGIIKWA